MEVVVCCYILTYNRLCWGTEGLLFCVGEESCTLWMWLICKYVVVGMMSGGSNVIKCPSRLVY
jgi:hypothetical protein